MTDAYLIWKTIHVVSATIVFGTGIGIAFFCWFGSRYALARRDMGVLRMAVAAESIEQLSAGFFSLFRIWFSLGIVAFAAMLGIFYLMVAKPLAVS